MNKLLVTASKGLALALLGLTLSSNINCMDSGGDYADWSEGSDQPRPQQNWPEAPFESTEPSVSAFDINDPLNSPRGFLLASLKNAVAVTGGVIVGGVIAGPAGSAAGVVVALNRDKIGDTILESLQSGKVKELQADNKKVRDSIAALTQESAAQKQKTDQLISSLKEKAKEISPLRRQVEKKDLEIQARDVQLKEMETKMQRMQAELQQQQRYAVSCQSDRY